MGGLGWDGLRWNRVGWFETAEGKGTGMGWDRIRREWKGWASKTLGESKGFLVEPQPQP